MKKGILLLAILLSIQANAGMFGYIKDKAVDGIKEKTKEKAFEVGKNVYAKNKKDRLEYEKKTKTKSALTKAEETVDLTKNTLKETVIGTVGKENIDFVKRSKGHFENALTGKQ